MTEDLEEMTLVKVLILSHFREKSPYGVYMSVYMRSNDGLTVESLSSGTYTINYLY